MEKKKIKGVLQSKAIKDGVVDKNILEINENIAKSLNEVFAKFKNESSTAYQKIKDYIKAKKYKDAWSLYKKYHLFIPNNEETFCELNKIDVSKLGTLEDEVQLNIEKFVIKDGLDDYEYIKNNAPVFIEKYRNYLELYQLHEFEFSIAFANINLGNFESALIQLDEILKQENLNTKLKAKIYYHKSNIENNLQYLELASDLYLQAGDIKKTINTKMILCEKIFNINPAKCLNLIEQVEQLSKSNNIEDLRLKSKVLFYKANYFFTVKEFKDSLSAVEKAIKAISTLYGNEVNEQRFGHYSFALILATELKNSKKMNAYSKKLKELKSTIQDEDYIKQLEAAHYMENADYKKLLEIKNNTSENKHLTYCINITLAMQDKSLTFAQKVELLEETEKDLDDHNTLNVKALLYYAYARVFIEAGNNEKFIEYASKSLKLNPFENGLRSQFLDVLIKEEKWNIIEKFSANQLELFGNIPIFIFLIGKSIYKQQQSEERLKYALGILGGVKKQLTDKKIIKDCEEMVDDLLTKKFEPDYSFFNKNKDVNAILTLFDFEEKLNDYINHIQRKCRMRFWKNEKGVHKYKECPETIAKDSFIDFFSSEFGENIEIIGEYNAGAGAIDLYIKFSKDLIILVELKMCGDNYSSSYALKGVKQLEHYYENSNSTLCYLLVYDARKKTNGKYFNKIINKKSYTINMKSIDITPKIKKE